MLSRFLWRTSKSIVTPNFAILKHCVQTGPTTSTLPKPPALHELTTEQDNASAMAWIKEFKELQGAIPRDQVQLSFSRSSGPGGQNVNKVNTKATLRCSLSQHWIPRWAISNLTKDAHYISSTHSILLASTVHRSQLQNINECLSKLHALILSAASKSIKHGPSTEQKKKVEELVKSDKARRKTDKMYRSSVKKGRSGKGGGFDF